jgi:hypothetical protein
VSTSGALQRIRRPTRNHIRFIGLKNFSDRFLGSPLHLIARVSLALAERSHELPPCPTSFTEAGHRARWVQAVGPPRDFSARLLRVVALKSQSRLRRREMPCVGSVPAPFAALVIAKSDRLSFNLAFGATPMDSACPSSPVITRTPMVGLQPERGTLLTISMRRIGLASVCLRPNLALVRRRSRLGAFKSSIGQTEARRPPLPFISASSSKAICWLGNYAPEPRCHWHGLPMCFPAGTIIVFRFAEGVGHGGRS